MTTEINDLILLSMDMAQMFLQRRSRLRVVCWIESFSESLPQASASWSRTSQSVRTDATLSVCCSMSRCRSCRSNSTETLPSTPTVRKQTRTHAAPSSGFLPITTTTCLEEHQGSCLKTSYCQKTHTNTGE